jgi:hypothetical protein
LQQFSSADESGLLLAYVDTPGYNRKALSSFLPLDERFQPIRLWLNLPCYNPFALGLRRKSSAGLAPHLSVFVVLALDVAVVGGSLFVITVDKEQVPAIAADALLYLNKAVAGALAYDVLHRIVPLSVFVLSQTDAHCTPYEHGVALCQNSGVLARGKKTRFRAK